MVLVEVDAESDDEMPGLRSPDASEESECLTLEELREAAGIAPTRARSTAARMRHPPHRPSRTSRSTFRSRAARATVRS